MGSSFPATTIVGSPYGELRRNEMTEELIGDLAAFLADLHGPYLDELRTMTDKELRETLYLPNFAKQLPLEQVKDEISVAWTEYCQT